MVQRGRKIFFEEIPNIPRFGERVEDIGKFKRKDLRPAENLKPTFRTIRNYLAANAVGITRDEVFASQIINIIFCKIYDERFKPHTVSGMLLYAATDETIQPDNSYKMSGNKISVRTLDLNRDFSDIAAQLNAIVDEHFS